MKSQAWLAAMAALIGLTLITVRGDGPASTDAAAQALAAERTKLLGKIPDAPANAVAFDAAQIRPLVDDDEHFKIEKNNPVPGLTTAWVGRPSYLLRDPDYDGGYWILSDVKPDRYSVGLWYESGKAGAEASQGIYGAVFLYQNGRIMACDRTTDPIQIAPGVFFAEIHTAQTEALQSGDEIAVLPQKGNRIRVARLTLYKDKPAAGRGWVPINFGGWWWNRETALGLSVDPEFLPAPGKTVGDLRRYFRFTQLAGLPSDLRKAADGKAIARCRIANPLGVPLKIDYTADVRAYCREIVGSDKATVVIQPHSRITREISFSLIPDSARYTIDCRAKALNPPGLGWPEADTISYFPGYRQSVPWRDPFSAWDGRALAFSEALPGARSRFALDGAWEAAFTTSLEPPMPPPAGLDWKPRSVPFSRGDMRTDKLSPRPHGLYVRRTFVVPAAGANQTYRLAIEDVTDEATAYVNGQRVGNVRGGNTPLICDVTPHLKAGTNEVMIVVRDLLAIMDPAYVNPTNPVMSQDYLDAPGLASQEGLALGSVDMQSSPSVAASDVLVITSVRRQEITARFQVTNHDKAPRKLYVAARVLDAGQPVMELGNGQIELAPEQSSPLTLTQPWKNPVLWGPGHPQLYTLAVEITDAASGQPVDLLRTRFGFRESWIENSRIMWNGVPVNLKGSTVHGGQGVNIGDIMLSRGAYEPDFMDEFGYLCSFALTDVSNSSSRHNVERDAFWESARRNALAGAAVYASHPCIIAWDLSNEWLCFLIYGGADVMAGARRLKAFADAVQAFDPSRWTFFDGDGDLRGLHDNISTHYVVEGSHPSAIAGFGFDGHSVYYPDGAFFRPLNRDFRPGEKVKLNAYQDEFYAYGEKVLMDTENLWKTANLMPPGPSKFAGDEDVLSPAFDSGSGPIGWMWKQNIDAQRDLGVASVCNYSFLPGVAGRGHMTQCFIMPDVTHHFFGGGLFARKYSLHNDLLVPAKFELRWRLVDPTGEVVTRGKDKRAMVSGDLQRGVLGFALPEVPAHTTFTLDVQLLADGKFAYGEARDVEVWPAPAKAPAPLGPLARKLMLFDPVGRSATVLQQAGIPFEAVKTLDVPGDPAATVLIIGEGAVQDTDNEATGPLNSYVSAGGRIVVLAQDKNLPGLPVRTALEPKEWSSMPFVRTPQHPVMNGISSWDLHFWTPDRVTARGAYTRPESGGFVAIVDSGTDTGMDWVQMMECYRGKGLYLLCQLPLVAKYNAEPMAREILGRLITYAAGAAPFRMPDRTLQVQAAAGAPVAARLRDIGVLCDEVKADTPATEATVRLVDAQLLEPTSTVPTACQAVLNAGGTLIIHGATPAQQGLLTQLAGKPVTVTVQPFGTWEGRGCRNGFTALTPGLSQVDLYWKRYEGHESATCQAEQPQFKLEDFNTWSASATDAVEHIFPGALVEIPVGKGRLILDETRWETTNQQLIPLAGRLLSSMLTGLNVEIEPFAAPPSLPKNVAYKPVDLTALANRGFVDEVGDDGQGGWSDQGPLIDLREFPTGRQMFGGVPFLVGAEPHGCIVLQSSMRPFPAQQPDAVTIPLGFPAQGLYFLHSATYSGGDTNGLYQIQYDDGTVYNLWLVGGENIRDWTAAPMSFPRERGTASRVVWTGNTRVFQGVSVFQMLWVNPKPDVPIKAVRFDNPGRKGCPILISLTAAVKSDKSEAEVAAAQARAKELLAKGQTGFDANKDQEARDFFKQAADADPTLSGAHRMLAQVCERMKDEAGAMAAYQAWADAGATAPLPYNRIGEMLERKKDYKGALDAYTKSLQVEWNQPPIIAAKQRLADLLSK
jgi:hypothetical protein